MKGNWLKRMGRTALAGGTGLVMLASAAAFPVGAADVGGTSATRLLGDVDRDGEVTTADAALLLQYSAKLIYGNDLAPSVGDIDGSGTVDVADAVLALQTAAKLLEKAPCQVLDISGAVELRGMDLHSSEIFDSVSDFAWVRGEYTGDAAVLASFDAAFFESHSLVMIGGDRVSARNMTAQELLWDGTQYRATVTYTETADYWLKPRDNAVLLIPVAKRQANGVAVTYQMVIKATDGEFVNSFLWVSSDETPNFMSVKENLYTVRSRTELQDIVSPICRTENRTLAFDQLVAAHDDAFFTDHVMLVLTCNYTDHYALVGFRENEDGTRTLLISSDGIPSDPSRPNAIAPRPCIFTVDVPTSFLEGHPVTGYEVVS